MERPGGGLAGETEAAAISAIGAEGADTGGCCGCDCEVADEDVDSLIWGIDDDMDSMLLDEVLWLEGTGRLEMEFTGALCPVMLDGRLELSMTLLPLGLLILLLLDVVVGRVSEDATFAADDI